MTFLAEPKLYVGDQVKVYVDGLTWKKWKPKFIVLHNTAVPTLKDWTNPKHTSKQRMEGQRHYERDILHWHSGPQFFATPEGVWTLCEPTEDGVHCSCFNKLSIGIEMVGDFETEAFNEGLGSKVRDNAVTLIAALCNKHGWTPDPLVIGERGLHFHKMCKRDHHDCPGKNVDRDDVVKRVVAEMARLKAL